MLDSILAFLKTFYYITKNWNGKYQIFSRYPLVFRVSYNLATEIPRRCITLQRVPLHTVRKLFLNKTTLEYHKRFPKQSTVSQIIKSYPLQGFWAIQTVPIWALPGLFLYAHEYLWSCIKLCRQPRSRFERPCRFLFSIASDKLSYSQVTVPWSWYISEREIFPSSNWLNMSQAMVLLR